MVENVLKIIQDILNEKEYTIWQEQTRDKLELESDMIASTSDAIVIVELIKQGQNFYREFLSAQSRAKELCEYLLRDKYDISRNVDIHIVLVVLAPETGEDFYRKVEEVRHELSICRKIVIILETTDLLMEEAEIRNMLEHGLLPILPSKIGGQKYLGIDPLESLKQQLDNELATELIDGFKQDQEGGISTTIKRRIEKEEHET